MVQRLHAEVAKALSQQDTRRQLAEQGYEPAGSTPGEFTQFIRTEIESGRRR